MKDDDDYAFIMRNAIHSKSVSNMIMNSGVSKYMTSYRAAFDTYDNRFMQCAFG